MGFSRLTLGLTHLRIWKHRQLKYEDVWLGIGVSSTLGFRNRRAMCARAWSKNISVRISSDCSVWRANLYNSPGNNARVSHNGARLKPWFHYHIPGWNCSFWGTPCVQSRCNALFKTADVHASTHILKFYHAASKRSEQFLKGPCVWKCVPISRTLCLLVVVNQTDQVSLCENTVNHISSVYTLNVCSANMVKFRCHMLLLLQFWIGRSSRFGECFCHAPIILLHIARCKAYRNWFWQGNFDWFCPCG